MPRAGRAVDESISCRGLTGSEVRHLIVERVGAENGYRVVGVGADRFHFARSVRPRWATILGWSTAVTGVGLLFLLVRTTETCSAVLEEDHSGVRVRLTGRLDGPLYDELRSTVSSASRGPVVVPPIVPTTAATAAQPVVVPGPEPPPVPLSPEPVPEVQLPPSPSLGAVPPLAAYPPQPGGDTDPSRSLVAARSDVTLTPVAGQALGWLLEFDDGTRIPLDGPILVGRDPALAPDDPPETVLAQVEDPGRSVSKTHLVVGLDAGRVWVADRHSTNGTFIVDPQGSVAPVPAGGRTEVPRGCTVAFGDVRMRPTQVLGAQAAEQISQGRIA